MDFIKLVKQVTGKNTPFTIDIRYPNEGQLVAIVILKSTEHDISFEPLVINTEEEEFENIFLPRLEAHYEELKQDITDVEKFLGAKTAKQTKTIKEEVKEAVQRPKHPEEVEDDGFDLDF